VDVMFLVMESLGRGSYFAWMMMGRDKERGKLLYGSGVHMT
jgi:hypothetical protein